MRTFAEMKAAVAAHNEAQDKNFLGKIVEDVIAEIDANCTCETAGCNNTVDEDGDLCHGCEAELSHSNFWGSGIPMGHHDPS